ncbi:DeoR/GlpR family DNA-binding transcription regulator [Rhizosphaericola mali]|uniref:DeoR/GlpR transcriptional regulator n=1 Tax=Rhizosphaericola mali TaxID=2545455 RepID=A0A5P2G3Z4_9BACT|nr:DeoR/GlpR family DNA-binding transcription regulator [Rhizosphaericola mali]QES87823.1 DeoR/GlpR transcriptional regulator [Rhizosphaericola mali]
MLKKERQYYILQQLNIHNKVLVTDLCLQMNVSEDTVRRDLQELSDNGKLLKVHGGALSNSFGRTLPDKNIYALPEKQIIAHKGASLIKDGMLVLLSGGSSVLELIRQLPPDLNATFVTPSIAAAQELINHSNSEVIFIGNQIYKSARMAVGVEVVRKLNDLHADLCFIGTNGIDIEHGLTDVDWEVLEVKRAMIASAEKTVLLTISQKLNTAQRLRCCKIEEIEYLLTELDPSDPKLQSYINKGVKVF